MQLDGLSNLRKKSRKVCQTYMKETEAQHQDQEQYKRHVINNKKVSDT